MLLNLGKKKWQDGGNDEQRLQKRLFEKMNSSLSTDWLRANLTGHGGLVTRIRNMTCIYIYIHDFACCFLVCEPLRLVKAVCSAAPRSDFCAVQDGLKLTNFDTHESDNEKTALGLQGGTRYFSCLSSSKDTVPGHEQIPFKGPKDNIHLIHIYIYIITVHVFTYMRFCHFQESGLDTHTYIYIYIYCFCRLG